MMTVLTDEEIDDRLRRIEDELGIEDDEERSSSNRGSSAKTQDDEEEDLPTFIGWQMEERIGEVRQLTVWRDTMGDAWIEYPNGDADCYNESADVLRELLEEARR